MNSNGMLRHLSFIEELARLEETDASWHAVSAGLVALRLFDNWVEDGPSVVATDSWAVNAVSGAIAEIPPTTPVRSILRGVLEAMISQRGVDLHPVTPRLMAYAQALEYDAKWALAADVYQTIIAHSHPIDESDLVVPAHIRLASCFRLMDDLVSAAQAFERAATIANAVGDMIGVLNARIGEAKLASARGNMPRAEEILDETIDRAREYGLVDVRSRALHDRAYTAIMRGDYEQSIRYAYDALEISTSPRERDRILGDIAGSFMMLGLLDVARDAYVLLAATAQEQYVRWTSALNLMGIAARQGMQPIFDRYRREMGSAELPPHLRAAYLVQVGEGYLALGRGDAAVPYLERAVDVAAEYQLNQVSFQAEEFLRHARSNARRPERVPQPEIASSIRGVAEAIHAMREKVGAS